MFIFIYSLLCKKTAELKYFNLNQKYSHPAEYTAAKTAGTINGIPPFHIAM